MAVSNRECFKTCRKMKGLIPSHSTKNVLMGGKPTVFQISGVKKYIFFPVFWRYLRNRLRLKVANLNDKIWVLHLERLTRYRQEIFFFLTLSKTVRYVFLECAKESLPSFSDTWFETPCIFITLCMCFNYQGQFLFYCKYIKHWKRTQIISLNNYQVTFFLNYDIFKWLNAYFVLLRHWRREKIGVRVQTN